MKTDKNQTACTAFLSVKKIHRNLAFLFTGIAGLILITMSVGYLCLSEGEIKDNRYLAFLRESDTIISNMELQRNISNDWLTKISANNDCLLALYDAGLPLTYTTMHLNEQEQQLAKAILDFALKDDVFKEHPSYEGASTHTSFSYQDRNGITYYASTARFGTVSAPLYAVIFVSTQPLNQQLVCQRFRFALVDALGILLLFLFSWFYTGKLLWPIVESQKKQNEFLAAVSHELRTPVAVILSCLSAAKLADTEKKEEFLSIIEQEGKRMSGLIADMLTLTRADSHTWSFHMRETELDTLFLNIYEAFLPQAVENHICLSVTLPEEELPPCICDAERITQVLSILLSNAISYGKDGKSIELSLSCHSLSYFFTVTDHGIGISDEAKTHIFERFYREDVSRSAKEHYGLGLSIAKEIIDVHRGSITVADTPGGGTTFTVKLPQKTT